MTEAGSLQNVICNETFYPHFTGSGAYPPYWPNSWLDKYFYVCSWGCWSQAIFKTMLVMLKDFLAATCMSNKDDLGKCTILLFFKDSVLSFFLELNSSGCYTPAREWQQLSSHALPADVILKPQLITTDILFEEITFQKVLRQGCQPLSPRGTWTG